jgi:phospholipid N-methyltransferase
MPYSSDLLDNKIEKVLIKIKPKIIYDIGAGAGKYGSLARKIFNQDVKLTAIEIDSEYINRFNLEKLYNKVLCMSATDLINPKFYSTNFDTVIIGDCIEHLKKSDGIDLLNFLVYRSHWILIQYPVKYIQNTFEGKHQEAHLSVWEDKDFQSFEVKKKLLSGQQKFVLIKGYLC